MFTVSYSIDNLDTNPTKMTFDTLDEAHDWIHEEVTRRVDFTVQHSPYAMSETDIQDLEANEYALVSLKDEDGVIAT